MQEFQSTLSVRRATQSHDHSEAVRYISIHALRKESDQARFERAQGHAISIHALRKESDVPSATAGYPSCTLFQSTLSVRRATGRTHLTAVIICISIHALRKESDAGGIFAVDAHAISIHALRKESDPFPKNCWPLFCNFNPRSP